MMGRYIIRLDDACEKRDIEKWDRMERLLDKYGVKPLIGVIPNCKDEMMNGYAVDRDFWDRVNEWIQKGWSIAMHGYSHVYSSDCGGINPVNNKSEFAGEAFEVQVEKIKMGIEIFRRHAIDPKIFFAPSHTFDNNTIKAIKQESNIRIMSDTIANDVYCKDGITFVPQQSGSVRKLPFKTVTFCYHPNTMKEDDFKKLEVFLDNYSTRFVDFGDVCSTTRKYTITDWILKTAYFARRH